MPSSNIIDAPSALKGSRFEFDLFPKRSTQLSPFTGRVTRYGLGSSVWVGALTLHATYFQEGASIRALSLRLTETDDSALRINGLWGAVRRGSTAADTIYAFGSANAGAVSISVDGLGSASTLLSGSFINISDSIYMVLEDAVANSSGEASLFILPPLRANVADNSSIKTNPVSFTSTWIVQDAPLPAMERGMFEPVVWSLVEDV